MNAQERPAKAAWRVSPAPPEGFAPFTATADELRKHGLPQRPDPREQPYLAALWDTSARRYQGFEHLSPDIKVSEPGAPVSPASLYPLENCGYSLSTTSSQPFTALFVHWTVPHLIYTPAPLNMNYFHTFVEIAYNADVHVDMTVDSAQNVTAVVAVSGYPITNLPVVPGDFLSAIICVNAQPGGSKVFVFVANETTGQTVNLSTTANLPALSIDAGIAVDLVQNNPTLNKVPRFGVVYFDEILAYTTGGTRSLTAGSPVSLTDLQGNTIATPYPLNDEAFKALHR